MKNVLVICAAGLFVAYMDANSIFSKTMRISKEIENQNLKAIVITVGIVFAGYAAVRSYKNIVRL